MRVDKVMDRKKDIKKVLIYIIICLPLTWLVMGISYGLVKKEMAMNFADLLLQVSMFIPALVGILSCLIHRETISDLKLLPNFVQNKKLYPIVIFGGIIFSVVSELCVVVIFSDIREISSDSMPELFFMIMMCTWVSVINCASALGEEIGWMGYLYPKMEKICGMSKAVVLTGIIRSMWHLAMIFQMELKEGIIEFVFLCVTNIILGSVLVYVTKLSDSIVPAAIIHSVTNSVPYAFTGFTVTNQVLFEEKYILIKIVELIPAIVVGVVCYIRCRKNMVK